MYGGSEDDIIWANISVWKAVYVAVKSKDSSYINMV